MKKSYFVFLLLLIAIFPALMGIFHPGFFITDDGSWMVVRLSAFYETLRSGQFPTRFLSQLNYGFGYPVADFLYPLFLYIGSLIHIFHVQYTLTIKILFGLSLFSGAVGMYSWLRNRFNSTASCVGAIIFTLFPYHLWDITKRGSLGEIIALSIVPFIFLTIKKKNYILVSILLAFLITAHNSIALLFFPILIAYMFLEDYWKNILTVVVVGLGLSSFFWLPALFDKQFTIFDKTVVSTFRNYFLTNNLYPLIGIISFVVIALSLFFFIKKPRSINAFFLAVALLSLSLTMSVSLQIWIFFHLGTYIQFPFRFLSITSFAVGFLSASVLEDWKGKQMIVIAAAFLLLVFVSSWQYFFARSYQYVPESFYTTNQDTTTVQGEYMPIWVKKLPSVSKRIQIATGTAQNVIQKGTSLFFKVNLLEPSKAIVSFIYFPGWKTYLDNKEVQINPAPVTGFITFSIPKGNHAIRVDFEETPLRLFADSLSLVFLIGICGIVVWSSMKRKKI